MALLDNLQPDQRAVLQMVLQRGRSYDEIANLLGIDREAVRQRALSALDALTPMAVIPGPERALVTDYLLGQLPAMVADQVYGYLEASEPDREWGASLASVLSPLAPESLPEIPAGGVGDAATRPSNPEPAHGADELWRDEPFPVHGSDPAPETRGEPGPAEPERERFREPDPDAPSSIEASEIPEPPQRPETRVPIAVPSGPTASPLTARTRDPRRSERQTGARHGSPASGGRLWAWGLLTAAIIGVVVVVVVATSGSSKHTGHTQQTTTVQTVPVKTHTDTTSTTDSTRTTSPTATQTTPTLQRLALLHLNSPDGASGTTGIAQVVRSRRVDTVVINAQGLPANTAHDAYAVWLSNSLSDSRMIGWVQAIVTGNGRLSTEGTLPAGAGHYHRVLVTLETQAKPTEPGQIVLAGVFREHS